MHQLTLQVLRNLYQQIPLPPVEHTELSHKLEEYTGVYENPAYGELKVELAKNGLYLHFKDWLLPMEHFHYDTFRVRGVKEDTIFITMPLFFFGGEQMQKVMFYDKAGLLAEQIKNMEFWTMHQEFLLLDTARTEEELVRFLWRIKRNTECMRSWSAEDPGLRNCCAGKNSQAMVWCLRKIWKTSSQTGRAAFRESRFFLTNTA